MLNVGLNMVASGLSAPTQSGTGIAAATLSPALSYEIGQHFKGLAQANGGKLSNGQEAAHILAHAILGAATAAAGGNDAVTGALSAGGAEAAAPVVSHWLYGTEDAEKLTEEQKDTVTAITRALGTSMGAAVGGSSANAMQGSLNADSAVENNNGAARSRGMSPRSLTEIEESESELNGRRIQVLTEQIRKIEPDFNGIPIFRDPNRPISREEVNQYINYLNRITFNRQSPLIQRSFTKVEPLSPMEMRQQVDELLRESNREITLNNLGKAFNARQRINGNLDASKIDIQIGLRTVSPNSSASKRGMPIYENVSEREIFDLYEHYTGSRPNFREIANGKMLSAGKISSGSWQGTTVVLRNYSTSRKDTGAKWTIEFQNYPDSIRGNTVELKFK